MNVNVKAVRSKPFLLTAAVGVLVVLGTRSHPAEAAPDPLVADFSNRVQPFLKANCVKCHNADTQMSGVRVDNLDGTLDDRHVKVWEQARHRIEEGSMPPKGMPQPNAADRKMMVDWITRGLEVARSRPAPKNGIARRLTVAQYRNTLRDLLQLEDDFTEIIPPDAVSKDGFVNNRETLQLNPLLLETYLEIARSSTRRRSRRFRISVWISARTSTRVR
jgi:mono/diheme cytochrome c family protein